MFKKDQWYFLSLKFIDIFIVICRNNNALIGAVVVFIAVIIFVFVVFVVVVVVIVIISIIISYHDTNKNSCIADDTISPHAIVCTP